MLVTCENCNAKFKLDESLIKESGSKVRCSKCRHVFTAYRPPSSEADLMSEPDLDSDLSELSDESEEASLDFGLFDTEGGKDEELSLEDFGLEDEPESGAKSGVSDDAVSEDEITAADLGFDDVAGEDVSDTSSADLPAEEEAEEDLSLDDLTLEDEGMEAETAETTEGPEEEISLEGLSLEEDASEDETFAPSEDVREQDLSFDELSLEEDSADEVSMEGDAQDASAEETEFSISDDVPVASMEDGEESAEPEIEEAPSVPPPPETAKRKTVGAPLLIVLILVLAAGGGYLGYTLVKGGDINLPFLESLSGADTSDVIDPGNLRITLLEDAIEGEFVENRSAGRVFVIKGKVKNDYPDMRNFIQVKGNLYLKNGKIARDQTVYAGNILSGTELQTLNKEQVSRKLNNRFGENKSNFRVPRGKVLPFMLVFFDIPQDLGEFSVEVVGSVPGSD